MTDLPAGVAPAVRLLLADLDVGGVERIAATVRARHEATQAAGDDGDALAAMTALSALVCERLAPSAHGRAAGPTGGPWGGSAPQA
jgi:hypothetical protein